MAELQALVCFRLARDEMLLALGSPSAPEEKEHIALTRELLKAAVRSLQEHPARERDWSLMHPARPHCPN